MIVPVLVQQGSARPMEGLSAVSVVPRSSDRTEGL